MSTTEIKANKPQKFFIDFFAVLTVTSFIVFLSGAEKHTPFFTPDSEFYLTLGAYDNDVTDRAPWPAYYWTKLGIIIPLKFFLLFFGFELGWLLFYFFVVFLFVSSIYIVGKLISKQIILSSFVSLLVAGNSVFLFFAANTYATGIGMAILSLLIALLCLRVFSEKKNTNFEVIELSIGFLVAWLVMVNPYSGMLGVLYLLGIYSYLLITTKSFFQLLHSALRVAFGFFSGLGVFLIAGLLIFPKLNWLQVVFHYGRSLNSSDYSSPDYSSWIFTSTALLVLVIPIFSSLLMIIFYKKNKSINLISFFLSFSGFILASWFTFGLNAVQLEAQFYSAFLWPAALIGSVLLVTSNLKVNTKKISVWIAILLSASFFLMISHVDTDINPVILLLLAGILILMVFLINAPFFVKSKIHPLLSLILITILFASFQVFQSSDMSKSEVVGRIPYSSAYIDTGTTQIFRQNLLIQKWLLSNTSSENKIFVWTDPNVYATSPASMQLFGPNSFQTILDENQKLSISEWNKTNLEVSGVNTIVAYALSQKMVEDLIFSLREVNFEGQIQKCESFDDGRSNNLTVCIISIKKI